MLLIADVIVDIDLDRFNGDVAIGMHRQRSQRRAVQLLKRFTPVTGQLLEWALVEFVQQGPDALVELGKREEGLMAQAGQDPALDDLHTHFRLGFVLGLVRACGHHRHLIVLGQLLVAGVKLGVISASLADTALEVVGDQ
ncbi:hypothetical protein D3C79_817440 [compost metagenome]